MEKDKVTVDLKYSIDCGDGNVITKLTFGRIKAKHLKVMPKQMMLDAAGGKEINLTAAEMIPVIAALAGLTEDQADEIDLEDLPAISEVIADFFDQYQGIGPESSGQ